MVGINRQLATMVERFQGRSNPSFYDDSAQFQETEFEDFQEGFEGKVSNKANGAAFPVAHVPSNDVDQYEEEDDENDGGFMTYFAQKFDKYQNDSVYKLFFSNDERTKELFTKSVPYLVLLGFAAYLISVIVIYSKIQQPDYWCSGDGLLYIMYLIVGVFLVYFQIIKRFFGKFLYRNLVKPFNEFFDKLWNKWYFKLIFFAIIIGGIVTFFILDTVNERRRLVSIIGLAFIIAFGFVFSHAPTKVRWRHVVWGLSIQFVLALLVLRWPMGNSILRCFADKVAEFLFFATDGAEFVFGYLTRPLAIFAFYVLPVTIYFSFFTSILFYYGIIQWAVVKVGWVFQITIGTTLCESMNASASIFLGMTESPLLIKPYLSQMTKSELHAIMTAGFATIAGSLLAAYVSLGVDPALLLTACVMNAPAALAISKLFYPETKETRITQEIVGSIKSEEINVLHAGCVGVTNALPLVANIAGNLIAFIAAIAFINSVFDWGCQLVDLEEGSCSLEGVFGYIFMPLAWMMGVVWADCYNVGQLIGLKVIINEFVAYSQLSEFIKDESLTPRSQAIATFALCGFSNISSIGIMMGGLFPLAPTRKNDMVKVVTRAMIAGSMATLSSACIAGTLLSDDFFMVSGNNDTMTTVSPCDYPFCPRQNY